MKGYKLKMLQQYQNNIFLTIGIPTYKRPDKLKVSLEHIQNNLSNNAIEIIVVDNDSDESVKKICSSFDLNIRYFQGNKDICSAESSISIIDKEAKGVYLWRLGDDDYINIDFDYIFKMLRDRPTFVLLSYSDLDLGKLKLIASLFPSQINKIIRFFLHYRLGFLSMCIVLTDAVKDNAIQLKYDKMGTLNQILRILINKKNVFIKILEKECFYASPNNSFLESAEEYYDVFISQPYKAFPNLSEKLGFIMWQIVFGRFPKRTISKKHRKINLENKSFAFKYLYLKSLAFTMENKK